MTTHDYDSLKLVTHHYESLMLSCTQTARSADTAWKNLENLKRYASTGIGANHMSRGLRLEVSVNAECLEDAFNLGVHKLRELVAQDLEVLVVPLKDFIAQADQALRWCRGQVRFHHMVENNKLDAAEVRSS